MKPWNSTLARKKGLEARKALARRTPLKPVNVERQKRRKRENEVYGPYFTWARNRPCTVLTIGDCWGATTAHHVKTVGSGGKDIDGLLPLCAKHHAELHQLGDLRFEERYRISLEIEAAYTHARYEREAP